MNLEPTEGLSTQGTPRSAKTLRVDKTDFAFAWCDRFPLFLSVFPPHSVPSSVKSLCFNVESCSVTLGRPKRESCTCRRRWCARPLADSPSGLTPLSCDGDHVIEGGRSAFTLSQCILVEQVTSLENAKVKLKEEKEKAEKDLKEKEDCVRKLAEEISLFKQEAQAEKVSLLVRMCPQTI